MAPLDDLPEVSTMLGINLRDAVFMIAALSIVHIVFYGCTFYMPMTYQLVTMWMLVVLFSGISVVLLYGAVMQQAFLLTIWIWFSLIFVILMIMMLFLLGLVFCSKSQKNRVGAVFLGILWYFLLIYFIIVVNSYRKQIIKKDGSHAALPPAKPAAPADTPVDSPADPPVDPPADPPAETPGGRTGQLRENASVTFDISDYTPTGIIPVYRKDAPANETYTFTNNETEPEMTLEEINNLTMKRAEKGSVFLYPESIDVTRTAARRSSRRNPYMTNSPYAKSTETTITLLKELKNLLSEEKSSNDDTKLLVDGIRWVISPK